MLTEEMIRKKIAENGGKGVWIENLPNDIYHLGPGHSSTDIKTILDSNMEKWLWKKANPEEPTHAKILGSMAHKFHLERDSFHDDYFMDSELPKAPARNTTEGKEKFKKWSAENAELFQSKYKCEMDSLQWQHEYVQAYFPEFKGRRRVSQSDFEIVSGISNSINKHPRLSLMTKPEECKRELSLYWIDKVTGLLCKCRPDILNPVLKLILDLKTCESASFESFQISVTNWAMYVSAWWYLWGTEEVFGEKYDDFIYIPAEKTAPFQVTYYPADEGSLSLGEGLCRAGLAIADRYYSQTRSGLNITHGGYSSEVKPIGPLPWVHNRLSQIIHAHDLHDAGLEKYIGA